MDAFLAYFVCALTQISVLQIRNQANEEGRLDVDMQFSLNQVLTEKTIVLTAMSCLNSITVLTSTCTFFIFYPTSDLRLLV